MRARVPLVGEEAAEEDTVSRRDGVSRAQEDGYRRRVSRLVYDVCYKLETCALSLLEHCSRCASVR